MTQNRIWNEDPRDNAKHKVRELPSLDGFFSGKGLFFSLLADWAPNRRFGFLRNHPTGPKCPKSSHDIAPMHYLHECITCCPTPSHAITAANATAPIKAMYQVPLPKEVHIIVPRYYISLPRAKGQAITCHCPATSAAIDPWQKSNSPNFRHYMPLPQVIGCDCPKTLHADATPIVVPGQGITCHCLTAYAPIAPMQYLSWP